MTWIINETASFHVSAKGLEQIRKLFFPSSLSFVRTPWKEGPTQVANHHFHSLLSKPKKKKWGESKSELAEIVRSLFLLFLALKTSFTHFFPLCSHHFPFLHSQFGPQFPGLGTKGPRFWPGGNYQLIDYCSSLSYFRLHSDCSCLAVSTLGCDKRQKTRRQTDERKSESSGRCQVSTTTFTHSLTPLSTSHWSKFVVGSGPETKFGSKASKEIGSTWSVLGPTGRRREADEIEFPLSSKWRPSRLAAEPLVPALYLIVRVAICHHLISHDQPWWQQCQ